MHQRTRSGAVSLNSFAVSGRYLGFALFLCVALPAVAMAQDKPVKSDDIGLINPEAAAHAFPKRGYSPYAGRNYPTRVFWGDEHVHTGWSADAGAFGATLGPEEALRFARGEEVKSSLGEPVKLSRPLDWAAITDHSDGAGRSSRSGMAIQILWSIRW